MRNLEYSSKQPATFNHQSEDKLMNTKSQIKRKITSLCRKEENLRSQLKETIVEKNKELEGMIPLVSNVSDALFIFESAAEKSTLRATAWELAVTFLNVSKQAGDNLYAIFKLGFKPSQKSWEHEDQLKKKAGLIISLVEDTETLNTLFRLEPDSLFAQISSLDESSLSDLIEARFKEILDGYRTLAEFELAEQYFGTTTLWVTLSITVDKTRARLQSLKQ